MVTALSVASVVLSAVGVGLGLASFILAYGRRAFKTRRSQASLMREAVRRFLGIED